VLDQIEHMVDDDDEEIKSIFNMLSIKVFPGGRKISDQDLAQIKRNKNNKMNKWMKSVESQVIRYIPEARLHWIF